MAKKEISNQDEQENGCIKIKLDQNVLTDVIAYASENNYGTSEAINFLLKVQLGKQDTGLKYCKPHLHSEKVYRLEKTVDNIMTLLFKIEESNRKLLNQVTDLENDLYRLSQDVDSTD